MRCRLFQEEIHRGRFGRISIMTCSVDNHVTGCGGYRQDCDKEYRLCPHATMQGPEAFCKHVGEVRDCAGDQDRCDLVESMQKTMEWVK
jgi:hypothetical protein